ncbi:dentin sialophosphoprotein-like isoform X1 [Arapaima gigas]
MRRGRRKGGNKEKVFGCDLSEHLSASSQEIPLVLKCCSEFIEEHGIVDGIYRLSGVSSNTTRLRSEFEGEGIPDLNKDVYLQDIHCVSSLCKAYFRELPNPLLTYQLYDKFAEAVAIHLEEERLVKIKEVLKELPWPNYRTLEYLMHHLVRMAAHATQTNMHARNLAIVWAPNLLRSKDIEATGLNGTAAFMEVRVQSVVVEFILTHVSQLFPEAGQVCERRQSLPSSTPPAPHHDDKSSQVNTFQFLGTISPGDGPPPMRPYHAIIEGTDKRKGSLKGKKWTSIFNLGGRLGDPKKKSKYPRKDKEKNSLRPAKSMDSLSTISPSQGGLPMRTPTCQLSLANQQSTSLSGEAGATGGSTGGIGSSYAVTYRRGGGASVSVVSGSGTPGTYSRLDGGGAADTQHPQPRSPAACSKAERRAGMHISGPFSVTVPLHITSGLALGVLQSAPGERGEELLLQKGEGREESRKEDTEDKAEEEDHMKALTGEGKEAEAEEGTDGSDGGTEAEDEEEKEEEEEEAILKNREEERKNSEGQVQPAGDTGQEHRLDEERGINGHGLPVTEIQAEREAAKEVKKTKRDGEAGGLTREDKGKGGKEDQREDKEEDDYVAEMKGGLPQYEDFPLDFQDTFGFLDHIDSSTFNQMNEFSVEPPCYDMEDEEESAEEEAQDKNISSFPYEQWNQPSLGMEDINVHSSQICPLKTFELHSMACKSLSLPYKSVLPNSGTASSDDDLDDEEDDQDEDGNDDEEDRLFYSLPSEALLNIKIDDEAERHETSEYAEDPNESVQNDHSHQPEPAQQACGANLNISMEHLSEEMSEDLTPGIQSSNELVHTEAPEVTQVHNEAKEEDTLVPAETTEQRDTEVPVDEGSAECQYTADPEDTPRNGDEPGQPAEINSGLSVENDPQTNTVQTESEVKTEGDISEGHYDKEICADVCNFDSVSGTNLAGETITSSVEPETPPGLDESQLVTYESPVVLVSPCDFPQDIGTVQEGLTVNSEEFKVVVSTEEEPASSLGNFEELTSTKRGEEEEKMADRETVGEELSGEPSEEGVLLLKVDEEECKKVDPFVSEDMDKSGTTEADGVLGESKGGETGLGESISNENKANVEEVEMMGKDESDKGQITSKHKERNDTNVGKESECREEGISNKKDLKESEDEKKERELEVGVESGRTLVASNQSQQLKMHPAKLVPVVPPKTELSKRAALNLRHQLQHRGTERGKEGELHKDWDKERDREGQSEADRERAEGEREGDREIKRNSPISMCFDEAVARETERREREKEERERERDKEKGTDQEL